MKLSSSYILPVIFCVLSHELWMVWSAPAANESDNIEEMCIEEPQEKQCLNEVLITMKEEKC